jgi:hypothetical protein
METADDPTTALMIAFWMAEIVAGGLTEAAAGFARVDKAAATRMIDALEIKFRDDVERGRVRLGLGEAGTQPMTVIQEYLDDAIRKSREAIEVASTLH